MFGSLDTSSISMLKNYRDAYKEWDRIVPIRGRSDPHIRPLGRRGDSSKTIRKDSNGDIAITYYHTDVITYHPDDSITLIPWASRTTQDLVNAVLPLGVLVSYPDTTYDDAYLQLGGYTDEDSRTYRFKSHIRFRGAEVLEGSIPFDWPRVNRAALNAACKEYGWPDFRLWVMASERIGALEPHLSPNHSMHCVGHTAIALLTKGVEHWPELVSKVSIRGDDAKTIANRLRLMIRTYDDCVIWDKHDIIHPDDLAAFRSAAKRFA